MASNQLNFSVWLRDRTSSGMASVNNRFRSLQRMGRQTQQSWSQLGMGAAGVWAVGQTMQALTGPAREMNAARGELNSLLDGDGTKTLNSVQNEAMKFASTYGKSASEFVRASYDIQSAISGLDGTELSKFTNASAILATATKADTATITSYMGTMYGIFQTNANKMGKSNWVEQIAGQTAVAVKMFKTTGSAMNEAFAGVGTRGSNQNISSAEQFAILGMAQAGKTGSTAGTAYAGFMDALPNAQKSLGLNFSGDNGKALGMVAIIKKLKASLGNELTVAVTGKLNTAFGTVASGLIQDLWNKTDDLNANIASLSQIDNMKQAMIMAAKIADPWDRLSQTINNVRVVFGQALDTALVPFITYFIDSFTTLQKWMVMFPHLTTAVAYLAIGFIALGAAAAIGMMVIGSWNILKFGGHILYVISGVRKLKNGIMGVTAAQKVARLATLRLSKAYLLTLKESVLSSFIRMKNSIVAATMATKALAISTLASGRASVLAFGSRLLSGIATMVSSLRTTLMITRALTLATFASGRASLFAFGGRAAGAIIGMASGVGRLLLGFISLIPVVWSLAVAFIAAIGWVPLLIAGIVIGVGILIAKWDQFVAAFSDTSWFTGIQAALGSFVSYLDSIGDWFNTTWSSITGFFSGDKLNATIEQQTNIINKGLGLSYQQSSQTQPTTLPQRYLSQTTQNQTTTHNVGAINVNTTTAPGRAEMNAYMAMVTP
ncbi:phage tail tape measure protein [Photobacterium phosphoreum]|uniref:Phage tail tape measure protein n=1 Tax=Photobacterium phosphoreum TaxID=659 RepID=A0AAW4ZQK2_PHOPO|nr:phage tail tape measure protein [Photobacterium phosphoreum]MCD9491356.1 phage tail tape measure protein [Photobacterium phosphoreum]MCD9502395.1 phage tail tape measure protein [Photobacterium phosphoreum]MCF2190622.1 phage tail tape measure protein [Photobacterium phosphoreum]MCF2302191.1 phage tail tape measure protein [Photobacterium phosphoreum]